MDVNHLTETLRRAAAHRGSAFVEIYQNCKVFNDGVFEYATDKGVKADNLVYLEHGKPLVFGQDQNRGVRLRGLRPEAVALTNGNGRRTPTCWCTTRRDPDTTLAHLSEPDGLPGICRSASACCAAWSGRPTATCSTARSADAVQSEGPGDLDDFFAGEDAWDVK